MRCKKSTAFQNEIRYKRQQITGIEPASPAWEASVLPMNYICMVSKTSVYSV